MKEYLLRASALEGYAETVTGLGGDPDALLGEVGLPTAVEDPDAWISYRAWLQLLELSAERLGCQHFGLELAQHQSPDILGIVGFIMREAPDVRTALLELRRHFAQHNQGGSIALEVEGDIAYWSFTIKESSLADSRQQYALVLGLGASIMRLLCGPNWQPTAGYLVHPAPPDTRPFRRLMNCPVYFNQEANAMTFDARLLDSKLAGANEHLHAILEQQLSALQRDFPDDFPAQVRQLIRRALKAGDCSVDRVANYLSMNKRTLQRQLKALGTSYKFLLDEVRMDIAQRYLRESSGSLTNLADMLCYTELSAFSNAFKARLGQSPRQWQKAHRRDQL
jgi:AraC-like DNA-binding protein